MWGGLPQPGCARSRTKAPFPLGSRCRLVANMLNGSQTSSLGWGVWGVLWRWVTSSDMPGSKARVGSLHTSLSSLLAPGLGCDVFRAPPLHSAHWNPLHLPEPRATKKSPLTFPGPRAGCSAVYFCHPQGPGVCPVHFQGSQLAVASLACSVTSGPLRNLLAEGFPGSNLKAQPLRCSGRMTLLSS